jgi:hypothetical protein
MAINDSYSDDRFEQASDKATGANIFHTSYQSLCKLLLPAI